MNFFSNVAAMIASITTQLQGIAIGVIVLCLVVVGFMFLFGEGPSRAAKRWLGWIVLGAVIVFGAATIAQTIQTTAGF